MQLKINGQSVETQNTPTVTELLTQQDVKMPEMVSVELNGRILKRSQFDQTQLADGDVVEFLYFMGGGK